MISKIFCRLGIHRMIPVERLNHSPVANKLVKLGGKYKACLKCCYTVREKEIISDWKSIEPEGEK